MGVLPVHDGPNAISNKRPVKAPPGGAGYAAIE